MGSAGLEWDTADVLTKARLNQKNIFIGTGTQISGLSSTYAGQLAFCTSTGSGFTADFVYVRDSTNTSWGNLPKKSFTESSSTPVTDDLNDPDLSGQRVYAFLTLPRTSQYYLITGIEWKNGTAVTGNVMCGVDIVDAIPPVSATKTLVAFASSDVVQTGTNSVQRNSDIISQLIPAGSTIGVWIATSSTGDIRALSTGSSQAYRFTWTYTTTPASTDTTAWGTWTSRPYIKVYYKSVDI